MAKYIIGEWVHNDGTHIYKVKHDINGNPRYIVHFTCINAYQRKAKKAAKQVGFSVCRKADYFMYFICSTYKGYDEVYRMIQQAKEISITT